MSQIMKTYLFQLVLCQQNIKMLGDEIGLAFLRRIAYNKGEPRGSKRVFRHPYPKCEALQQVFRHLYPKCGALTIRGDANPLVFCERDYRYEHPI